MISERASATGSWYRTTRPGLPRTTAWSGTSFITTAPAQRKTLSPIVFLPAAITTPVPALKLAPIVVEAPMTVFPPMTQFGPISMSWPIVTPTSGRITSGRGRGCREAR